MSGTGCLLVGCGSVGSGVVRLWNENAGGAVLRSVAVRDVHKGRSVDLSPFVVSADAAAAARAGDVAIVIEATSDEAVAYELAVAALTAGRAFVTASKSLVARHGPELERIAERAGGAFRYEAAVGGVLPVIGLLRHGLSPGRVQGFEAVLNGTCNFVLSRLGEGDSFDGALRAARHAGFAEEDSTRDTSGRDTAEKLVILARLAGVRLEPEQVATRGITGLDHGDLAFGHARGWSLKLVARFDARTPLADVAPTFVAAASLLAQARNEENAVVLDAGERGRVALVGPGAGGLPTAAAVLADVREVVAGVTTPRTPTAARDVRPDDAARTHYVRCKAPFASRSVSRELLAALGIAGIGTEAVTTDRPGGVSVLTRPVPGPVITRALAALRSCEVVLVPVLAPRASGAMSRERVDAAPEPAYNV